MTSQRPKASNSWTTGPFECMDLKNKKDCFISFFCFPCFACKTAKRYGECLCLPLIDQFGLMRVSMRHRYSIEGSIAEDCFISFCCCPCVWCQMSREMDAREPVTSQAR